MTNTNIDLSSTPAIFFVLPFLFIPLVIIAWLLGGISIALIPLYGYISISLLDFIFGPTEQNEIDYEDDKRYSIILWIWPAVQFFLIFGSIIIISTNEWNLLEGIFLMISLGIITGAIGITFAHELMHKKSKLERTLCDLLLGMVCYGHFRTEHLLVHHRFVGTKNDAVTARFNESFYRFFIRVLPECYISAWKVERERLLKRGRKAFSFKNPFWIYFGFILFFTLVSFVLGGFLGILLFIIQATIAIIHLEVVNYIEHYGLLRKQDENGRYEKVKRQHSWNSDHRIGQMLLFNLSRHSDHHYNGSKHYQTLKTVPDSPQMPTGYPGMMLLALFPPFWFLVMHKKIKTLS